MKVFERVFLMGVRVHLILLEDLIRMPVDACRFNEKMIFSNHNLHSIFIWHRDGIMRKFYARSTLTHIDGMPLIWIAKLLGYKATRLHRHTSPDWIIPFLKNCRDHGIRVYMLGSKPAVADKAVRIFRTLVPDLDVSFHHGYFDIRKNSPDTLRIIENINSTSPGVLLLGMGMPRQERWLIENFDLLQFNLAMNLGAFMDYWAGEKSMPNRTISRLGFEWLWRLISEPRRLYFRYCIEPLVLSKHLLRSWRNRK